MPIHLYIIIIYLHISFFIYIRDDDDIAAHTPTVGGERGGEEEGIIINLFLLI